MGHTRDLHYEQKSSAQAELGGGGDGGVSSHCDGARH